jgi:hypothetical protein
MRLIFKKLLYHSIKFNNKINIKMNSCKKIKKYSKLFLKNFNINLFWIK